MFPSHRLNINKKGKIITHLLIEFYSTTSISSCIFFIASFGTENMSPMAVAVEGTDIKYSRCLYGIQHVSGFSEQQKFW